MDDTNAPSRQELLGRATDDAAGEQPGEKFRTRCPVPRDGSDL
ncbi:hypothetical protein ACWZEH_35680 (plasmid) [Streptomyces sp. QTS137]